jgi:hypothetical protein
VVRCCPCPVGLSFNVFHWQVQDFCLVNMVGQACLNDFCFVVLLINIFCFMPIGVCSVADSLHSLHFLTWSFCTIVTTKCNADIMFKTWHLNLLKFKPKFSSSISSSISNTKSRVPSPVVHCNEEFASAQTHRYIIPGEDEVQGITCHAIRIHCADWRPYSRWFPQDIQRCFEDTLQSKRGHLHQKVEAEVSVQKGKIKAKSTCPICPCAYQVCAMVLPTGTTGQIISNTSRSYPGFEEIQGWAAVSSQC